MSQIVYLKRERVVELENEMNRLITVERKKIAEIIAEARSHGDLSENAEYDAAKEAQQHLEIKIKKLSNLLSRAKIINSEDMPDDEVFILSVVTVKDLKFKDVIKITLVSEEEADFELDKISIISPMGKSLLGKKVGDIAKIEVGSNVIEYEILEISKN